jgi:glycerophosphoryl diester phosphodiesterase
MLINVELTNYLSQWDPLPVRVAELVRRFSLQDWVIFSSFSPITLLRIRRLLPEIPAALLADTGPSGRTARSRIGEWLSPELIHPFCDDVEPSFMKRQQQIKRRTHVWTVNDPKEMERLASLKVDGIFTDDPVLARKVLKV